MVAYGLRLGVEGRPWERMYEGAARGTGCSRQGDAWDVDLDRASSGVEAAWFGLVMLLPWEEISTWSVVEAVA